MNKNPDSVRFWAIAVVAFLAFGTYMLLASAPVTGAPSPAQAISAQTPVRAALAQLDRSQPSQSSVTISPFGMGEPVHEDRSHRIAARRARMEAWNYSTPAKYFTMGLDELKKLAQAGDAFALIQLGEQYSMESDALQSEPGFDPKGDPNLLARESFTAAIRVGQTEIVSIMAMKALEKNDVVDALAWKMVTDTMRPPNAAMLDQYAMRFSELNLAQKDEARRKSSAIIHRLSESAPPPP